jgi:hypothetical protein
MQVHSFEIDRLQVEAVKKRCVFDLDTPLLEEVRSRACRRRKAPLGDSVCYVLDQGMVLKAIYKTIALLAHMKR